MFEAWLCYPILLEDEEPKGPIIKFEEPDKHRYARVEHIVYSFIEKSY